MLFSGCPVSSIRFVLLCILCLFAECFSLSFDFVDTPISEVARSLSLAFETPVLVDSDIENRVTFHFDGVGVFEGLTALCESMGLEVVEEGKFFRIRRALNHGDFSFAVSDSLVSISVRNKDVLEFIQEYGANTGLNILPSPKVSGRISGDIKNMPAEKAFTVLMESYGYRVRKNQGCVWIDVKSSSENNDSLFEIEIEGNLYSVDFDDTPLLRALDAIAKLANLNLAVYGNVQETIRLRFTKVPLHVLVNSLFKGSEYTYFLDSENLFVAPRGMKNALSKISLYPLKFVSAEKALELLNKFLPSGNFVMSEVKEQNALLLGGSESEIESAKILLNKIDVPSLQVTLSCLIVEIKKGKNFEIGLHSGVDRKTGESDFGVRGFYDFMGKNLSKTGALGKIGILPDRFELELSSLEENNLAEVLARPKLTTLNGNKAELNVTNTVYYLVSQVSADGYPITDYRSFNDGISLELTPSVTQGGSITLDVSPEIKTAGRSTGDGPRDISTRNLKTTVVLKNGETLCLGGLRRKNKSEVRSAIPFLGSLPVIGRFFSYLSEEEEESELVIFITPEVNGHAEK